MDYIYILYAFNNVNLSLSLILAADGYVYMFFEIVYVRKYVWLTA